MKRVRNSVGKIALMLVLLIAAGCSSTGGNSAHGSMSYTVGYGGYYSPYPYWGHGGNVVIVNPDHDDHHHRPIQPREPSTRPAVVRPAGGIGRPRPRRR